MNSDTIFCMKESIVRVLRWSEQYTKTDMVYFVKNSGWVFFGQLATSLSAFFIMVALANLVDKGEYGEYRFIIAIVLILAIFTLPGMNTALVQSTARGFEGQLAHIVYTRIRWGALATMVAGAISAYYFLQGNQGLGASLAIVALFIPFYGAYFSYFFYLHGKQLFNEAAIIQAAAQMVFMIIMIATAFLTPTATSLIASYMFATIAIQYAGYQYTKNKHTASITNQDTDQQDQEAVNYGKYLTLWNVTPNAIATQVGIITIWYFLGAVEAAIYAIAMMIPMECNRFGAILNQVAMPKLSRQKIDIRALFGKILKLEIVLVSIWIAYALSASYIFTIFFPKYPEAVHLSIIAMLMVLLVPRLILKGLLNAKKMKSAIQKVSLTIPTLHIILTISFIPAWGVTGAVAATIVAWLIEFLLLIYFIQNKK